VNSVQPHQSCEAVRTLVKPYHFPAPPPSMISPQKTKSPRFFQPRFLYSGLDLRKPFLLQRAELPGARCRSNRSAASRTANRCLIILIIDTDRLVRDRQLTRIDLAKGKRKLAWRTLEPVTTTSTRPVAPKPRDAFRVHNQHLSSTSGPGAIARLVLARAGDCHPPLLTDMAALFGGETPAETSSSRVHRIYSSITETMKSLVARSL